MDTKATILIRKGNSEFWLFHFDGCPEGLGQDLKDYVSKIEIWDPEYIAGDLIESDLGYEQIPEQRVDAIYTYIIDCRHRNLECYRNFGGGYDPLFIYL